MLVDIMVESSPIGTLDGIMLEIIAKGSWEKEPLSFQRLFYKEEFISEWDRIIEEVKILFREKYLEEIKRNAQAP